MFFLLIIGTTMKKYLLLMLIGFAFVLLSCSESTNNTGTASVKFFSNLKSSLVSINTVKDNDIALAKTTIDSLVITRVRILIEELKLYKSNEDTNKIGQIVKVGPLLFEADNLGNSKLICSGNIPVGIYDKVKFEFHRFSSSEVDTYKNDPLFQDFATNDRYSAIISGIAYKDGVANYFTFNSTFTANLALNFVSPIEFKENETIEILLELDPTVLFKIDNDVIDPRDNKNQNDIDNAFKSAIKALKKLII